MEKSEIKNSEMENFDMEELEQLLRLNLQYSALASHRKNKKKSFDYKLYRDQMVKIKSSWLTKTPIAHRGLHGNGIPENSMASYAAAIKNKYAIEIDVRTTKDGKLVVCHDNKLTRLCGVNAKVSDLTLAQLKKIKLKDSDQTIPTLDEVLEFVDGRTPLLVELKSFRLNGKLERKAYNKLKKYQGKYAVQCFNPYSVSWFKNHAPQVIRGQLVSDYSKMPLPNPIKNLITKFFLENSAMPHFVSFQGTGYESVQKETEKGRTVIAWTVKTKEEYDKIIKYCDNIIFENFRPSQAMSANQ